MVRTRIEKSALRIRRSTIAFAFIFIFFGVSAHPNSASAASCSSCDPSCVCVGAVGDSGASQGDRSCQANSKVYKPSCNGGCNGGNVYSAAADSETPYACVSAVSNGAGAGNNGVCDENNYTCPQTGQTCEDGKFNPSCDNQCSATGKACFNYGIKGNGGNGAGGGGGGAATTNGVKCDPTKFMEDPTTGVCFPTDTKLPDTPVLIILGNFFGWLLAIFGFLAIGAFVISGIQYLIASGEEDMAKAAKRNMKWSIVGVIVGLSGYLIMQAVFEALSANPFF